jgi:hypothetical protein
MNAILLSGSGASAIQPPSRNAGHLIDLFDREFVEGQEATGIVSSLAN